MRIAHLLATLCLTAASLAACSPVEPSHDKAYYAANDAERTTKLAACQNDPGKMAATPDCVNAQAAEGDARTKHFYDVQKPASRVTKPGSL